MSPNFSIGSKMRRRKGSRIFGAWGLRFCRIKTNNFGVSRNRGRRSKKRLTSRKLLN